ncbi:TonB-dependent receptor [Sphingomonas sp. TREG-RG-20F-R18-01]|uniref:TonB-dependent receptor n=1 Tax=Sphingomonas sp. TREG-RG-20F-R18-01 TaxID=2914982 RepID=UPI001F58BE1D|nr:TonB-dependent receptor [Sphingomonas sp. TREG-RG-20F-R18-01]
MLAMAFGWSAAATSPALGQTLRVEISAGPIDRAITALARQSGTSIGADIPLGTTLTRGVHGRMSVAAALADMLRDTGLRAVRVGPDLWRIERAQRQAIRPARPNSPPSSREHAEQSDIVVTATKRRETLASAATPLTIASPERLAGVGDTPGTRDLAGSINGLSVTNLGPGRNRLFIRGIADSPFDGFGQSSVSVQVDESRVTYDAPDPDLRLIDMAQVEVLKGPQGPLYGTGALGGVYRLVPAKPDLTRASGSLRSGGSTTQSGSGAGDFDGVINLPLIPGRLAIRLVGYRIGQGGWINSTDGTRDLNHGQTSGGRIAVRARPFGDWIVDLQGITQGSSVADSQYVEAPHTLTRTPRLREPQDTGISLVSATANGSIAGARVTAVASATSQEVNATYDASSKAALLGGTAPASYRDARTYHVYTGEIRATGSAGRFDWLGGAALLTAETAATGTLAGATTVPVLRVRRSVNEAAVFGELTWHLSDRLRVGTGVRVFRSSVDDERAEGSIGGTISRAIVRASPSATIAWQHDARLLVFARYASALRPGGIDTTSVGASSPTSYQSDELQAYDLGARWSSPNNRLSLDLGLFASDWAHVQADYLAADGLISTRNAGDASNRGIDLSLQWRPARRISLSAGTLLQHARINPGALPGVEPDRRLPVIPDASAHGEASYALRLGRWQLRATGRASYIGETRLSFDPALDRESGPILLLSGSLSAEVAAWQIRAGLDNAGDTRADSFAFGNPFTVTAAPQRTPVRPRTVSLSVRRSF